MLKDFLYELFGIRFYGLTFERIFFMLLAVTGAVIAFRAWQARAAAQANKTEEPKDLYTRLAVGVGLVGFGGYQAVKAWFGANYALFFAEPLVLHTYGVAIAIGFVVAIVLGVREARRTGLDVARIMDMAFWFLIAGLVGARLVFMMVEWKDYYNMCVAPEEVGLIESNCFAIFEFWKGGLVFYGGLIGGVAAAIIYLRKYNLPAWRYSDAMVVSVPIGQFFGRLGCVSAGCCHGKYVPSDRLVALEWPIDTPAYRVLMDKPEIAVEKAKFLAEGFVTAHPTQLYESGAMLLVFLFLLWFRTRKTFHGQITLMYVIIYAFVRSFIEMFRGDTVRGFLFEYKNAAISGALGLLPEDPLVLSTSQAISVGSALAAGALWIYLSGRAKAEKAKIDATYAAGHAEAQAS